MASSACEEEHIGEAIETVVMEEFHEPILEESLIQEVAEEIEGGDVIADNEKIPEKAEKLVQVPLSRIKSLIKLDPDVSFASQEAVFMIAKATELFIETLAKEAYSFTKQNKKKTIQKKDIEDCIDAVDGLAFLEGTLEQ